MFFTSPTGVPSCLKPVAQHAPGGLEAILKSPREVKKKKNICTANQQGLYAQVCKEGGAKTKEEQG